MTFTHKVFLVLLAAFAFACLIEFYKNFIDGADRAVNDGYRMRGGMTITR
jgi:hypothetical protein